MNPQAQLVFEHRAGARQRPFRFLTSPTDRQPIVGVPGQVDPRPLHPLIKDVQINIAEQRADDSALRRTSDRAFIDAVSQHSGREYLTYQTQHLAVGDPFRHQRHESIMRDCPEEIGDVGIDDPSPAGLQLTPDPAHRQMRRTSRAKPETDLGERRLEDRLQHLAQRLLAHPVQDGGNAQRTLRRRSRLVDLHPTNRPGTVAAVPEPLLQHREVPPVVVLEPVDTDPVHPASASVLPHTLPGPRQVARVIHLSDQRVRLPRPHTCLCYPAGRRLVPGILARRRLGHCLSNHQSDADYSPNTSSGFAIPTVTPSPGRRLLSHRPPPHPHDGPKVSVVPWFSSTTGHSDFSHGIACDFASRLIRPATQPVERDRTRPPGVTQRTFPPRRPHTPCCVQMPQVFPSPP